jgi:hypothetical protein
MLGAERSRQFYLNGLRGGKGVVQSDAPGRCFDASVLD